MRIAILMAVFGLAVSGACAADIVAANARLGRGVNLGNALEAPREGEWGVTLEEAYFKLIRDAGFDSVRLPVRWSAHALTDEPYTLEETFAQRVDWAIDQALAHRLNIVVNVHHYEELFKDPAAHLPRLVGLWEQIARRYKDRPREVYFELLNEPHGKLQGQTWNDAIPPLLAAIRKSNPTRPVIVGTDHWGSIAGLENLKLPDDANLIVTVHCYDPFEFTHQGAEWVEVAKQWRDRRWVGNEEEQTQLRGLLERAAAWGKANHRPIYLGEFGAYSKADMDSRVRWTRFVTREAERLGMSWSYWEFSAGFGVYDPAKRSWRAPLRDALLAR